MKKHALLTGVAVFSVLASAGYVSAVPDRGLQVTPNGAYVLVNKDVGNERWAIALRNATNTVTGNVFRSDGGPPAFIVCNPLATPNGYSCFGADACSASGTQRGIQITPDDQHTLVNKDVGDDRWAIALSQSDGSATGNVFDSGGGPPSFISCTPTGSPNEFSCFGANGCTAEPCGDEFTFISEVTLPSTFFEVPDPCNESFSFIANVTLPDDFFRLTAVGDFVSSVETGGGTPGVPQVGAAPIPGPNPPDPIGGVNGDTTANPGGTNNVTVSLNSEELITGAVPAGFQSFLIVAVGDGSCVPDNLVTGYYQIPLESLSGDIPLEVSFAADLGIEDFVLCFTVVSNGVVGSYQGFTQHSSESQCGNGILNAGEACDPPLSQSQCDSGEICSSDCGECTLAGSCADRCCPGRDDFCTAPSAPCFCDEFCVTAQDCCPDAIEVCGFDPTPGPSF